MEIAIDGYTFIVPDSLKQVLNSNLSYFRVILKNGVDVVGLNVENGYLFDFDGVMVLSQSLATTLRKLGFIVPESCVR